MPVKTQKTLNNDVSDDLANVTVPISVFAELCGGVTERTVRNLIDRGWAAGAGRGRIYLNPSLRGHLLFQLITKQKLQHLEEHLLMLSGIEREVEQRNLQQAKKATGS